MNWTKVSDTLPTEYGTYLVGYKWNNPSGQASVYPVNPPKLADGDTLVRDLPGRCGGQDSHSYHYCLVRSAGSLNLLVRHGGGDERIRLSGPIGNTLATLNSTECLTLYETIVPEQNNGVTIKKYSTRFGWNYEQHIALNGVSTWWKLTKIRST